MVASNVSELMLELTRLDIKLWLEGGQLHYRAPRGVLTSALRQTLTKQKDDIILFLTERNSHKKRRSILPVSRDNSIPLSFAQERLWFLNQLVPNSTAYNVLSTLRVNGYLNEIVVEQCLNELIRRHEVLRTSFVVVDSQPVQVIAPALRIPLHVIDLSMIPSNMQETEARKLAAQEAEQTFDLTQIPLLCAALLKLDEDDFVLIIVVHHIISDGWSANVFNRELMTLYKAFLANEPSPLPELPIQYADYAAWQRKWLQGDVLEEQLDFWKQQLAGIPPVLELPIAKARATVSSNKGQQLLFSLSPETSDKLKQLSQQEGCTLYMTLLAAFNVLLHRYTSQDGIAVGTSIAGRNHPEVEDLIGFFVNTLVMHTQFSGDLNFLELLHQVKQMALDAYIHQEMPFEKVVAALHPERVLNRNPLFQVYFELQNLPRSSLKLSELDTDSWETQNWTAKFDLCLLMWEADEGLTGSLEYATDLYKQEDMLRMIGHLQVLLEGIAANPNLLLRELPILTKTEQRQLLVDWNATAQDFSPEQVCIHHLFEEQVEHAPDALAVTSLDEQITYKELNLRSNQLARFLRRQGIGPDDLVGICMERSLEMVVGLLGILKAGGAYVPLDPSYPHDRLAYMLADSNVSVLLTQEQQLEILPEHSARVICLDRDWKDLIASQVTSSLANVVTPLNLAYMIYTSGSTGKPKGAMNTHQGIYNRLLWMQSAYDLTRADRVLQKTPFSFDVSVWEFFWPLITGGQLVMAQTDGHKDSDYLIRLIVDTKITTLHFVPSMLSIFLQEPNLESCQSVKRVICSGEALPYRSQEQFFARLGAELHNLYGPTEAAVDVTYWACRRQDQRQIIPIGRPISNTQVYVLDKHLNPTPVMVPGELYIGGVGVARGYLNRPELTAEKFIPNPFSKVPGARLYRTNDLVHWLPDGNIEYLGRTDYQVKVRGFRIELGEIEAALRSHPAVQEAVVTTWDFSDDDKRIIAYLVPSNKEAPLVQQRIRFQKDEKKRGEWLELENGLVVNCQNKKETEFMYKEIFTNKSYLKHGITIKDGDCIFDVGANIGLFSLLVGKLYPNTMLYAFEPISPLFENLKANIEFHGLNAHLFDCGLSKESGYATFTYYPNVSILSGRYANIVEEKQIVKGFLLSDNDAMSNYTEFPNYIDELLADRLKNEKVVCELKTISEVIERNGIDQIDLLKIDVEKSELDILEGINDQDWEKIKQIVVEVFDSENRLDRVVNLLTCHGFEYLLEQDEQLRSSGFYYIYASKTHISENEDVNLENHDMSSGSPWNSPDQLIRDVRKALKAILPEYQLPSNYFLIDSIPLTHNGKIDKSSLPDPSNVRSEFEKDFVTPRTGLETSIASVWRDVLGIEEIGIHDNFFDLGGHSLLAMRLVSQINKKLDVKLSVAAIFESNTIEKIANYITQDTNKVSPLILLNNKHNPLPPFFCVHAVGGMVSSYINLSRQLNLEIPFYGIQTPISTINTLSTIEEIANYYLDEIKCIQKKGPYKLGGWSMGGVIAYEMARQLQLMGEEVSLLILIDSWNPFLLKNREMRTDQMMLRSYMEDLGISSSLIDWDSLYEMTEIDCLKYVLELGQKIKVLPEDDIFSLLYEGFAIYKHNFRAMLDYNPGTYASNTVLFIAKESMYNSSSHGWSSVCGKNLIIHTIEGDHYSILNPPDVTKWAQSLQSYLEKK